MKTKTVLLLVLAAAVLLYFVREKLSAWIWGAAIDAGAVGAVKARTAAQIEAEDRAMWLETYGAMDGYVSRNR